MTTESITRYVRYMPGDQSEAKYGLLEGETIQELEGDLLDNPRPTGRSLALDSVRLLVPLDPNRVAKVLGIAINYTLPGKTRIIPQGRWFCKFPSALNSHEGEVEVPPDAINFNFEGELVLVIGKEGKHISVEEAPDYIWGVTVGNDFSENGWNQEKNGTDGQSRQVSKGTDSWACLYTTIVKGMDYSDLGIEIRLNGELGTRGRTPDMNHKPAMLVSYISHFVTLQPGDIIYTGTVAPQSLPGTRKELQAGDVVEVEIENIGTLSNRLIPMKGEEPRLGV